MASQKCTACVYKEKEMTLEDLKEMEKCHECGCYESKWIEAGDWYGRICAKCHTMLECEE